MNGYSASSKAKPPKRFSVKPALPLIAASGAYQPPEPRNEQERQQRKQAEQRERALLWTDDRPFSIWKS